MISDLFSSWLCIAIAFFLGLLSFHGWSQIPPTRSFTVDDGLPQMQVDAIYEDNRGYIWVGTRGGLSKFNGETFTNYTDPKYIPNPKITSITEDVDGNIYFLAQNKVVKYDGAKFETLDIEIPEGRDIYISKKNVFITSYKIKSRQPEIRLFDVDNDFKDITNNYLKFNYPDERRFLMLDDSDLTHLVNDNSNRYFYYSKDSIEPVELTEFDVFEKLVHILCDDSSLALHAENRSIYNLYNQVKNDEYLLPSWPAFSTLINSRNKCRYSYFDRDQSLFKIIDFKNLELDAYSIDFDHESQDFYNGTRDIIWYGSDMGLIEITIKGFKIYNHPKLNMTWNVVDLGFDKIFFASYSNGFYLFENGHLSDLQRDSIIYDPYMGNVNIGESYFMPSSAGIFVFDINFDYRVKLIESEVDYNTIQYIYSDSNDSSFYCAGYGGVWKFIINQGNSNVQEIKFPEPDKYYYSNCIHWVDNKELWVGHENGLNIYSEDDNWIRFSAGLENFPSNDVATIYQDKHGNVWLGTGQGLVVGNSEKVFELIDDPLVNGVVNVIDSFDEDHIILGGSFGICILDINEWHQDRNIRGKIFNSSNGFTSYEPAENAIYRMRDGSLMVGTQTYPIRIYPRELDLTVDPLKTRILAVNDSLLPFEYRDHEFHLSMGSNDIKYKLESIGLYRPGETKYSYSLDGRSWSEYSTNSTIELNNLSGGVHDISFRTFTPGIDENDIPVTSLSFVVRIPFWKEPWFPKVLVVALILSVLTLLGLLVAGSIQRRRTRKYLTAIDYLRVQSIQSQMNPHFVFNVLGSLQNKILQQDPVEANRHLVNLSTLIRRFLESTVNSNIDRTGVDIIEHSIAKEIELLKLYIEFEQLQHESLFQYSIEVDESVDVQNTLIPPMILQPFVENAIKHGIMHKNGQGQLNVRIRSEDTALIFTIEDDGVGREAARMIKEKSIGSHRSLGTQLVEERIELLNKMGYQIELQVDDRPGGGTIVEIKMKSE